MRSYRISQVDVPRHGVVRLTFDDGLVGELDLVAYIDRGPYFTPLRDEAFFKAVSVAPDGRSFGWRLDRIGEEIDFGADGARADVETALVEARADRYRRRTLAAE